MESTIKVFEKRLPGPFGWTLGICAISEGTDAWNCEWVLVTPDTQRSPIHQSDKKPKAQFANPEALIPETQKELTREFGILARNLERRSRAGGHTFDPDLADEAQFPWKEVRAQDFFGLNDFFDDFFQYIGSHSGFDRFRGLQGRRTDQ